MVQVDGREDPSDCLEKKEVEKIKMKIGGVEGFVRFMWDTQQVVYVRRMKGVKKIIEAMLDKGWKGIDSGE